MIVNGVTPILNVADNVRVMHVRYPDGHCFRVNCGIEESKK